MRRVDIITIDRASLFGPALTAAHVTFDQDTADTLTESLINMYDKLLTIPAI